MDDAGADDNVAGQAQALEGAHDNDCNDAAAAVQLDNDLSSIAGTTSASLSTPSLSHESTAAKKGSDSSSSGYESLCARPKTWTRSKRYWNEVKRAARENKPDVLRELMKEDESYADEFGWTALHYAAFLGHTECVRILLNEKRCLIDIEAVDGSTALMVACANLPKSKECIKVLCEHKANKYKYKDKRTALIIAIERKPDLQVVKWLVSGADMSKLCFDSKRQECLMRWMWGFDLFGQRMVTFPPYIVNDEEGDENLRADETEVTEIALYLADQGYVKGALFGLLQSSATPQLLKEVVECLLEKGAVLNELNDKEDPWEDLEGAMDSKCKPRVLSLFAKKSLIYLEGISTLWTSYMHKWPRFKAHANALAILLFRGQASGFLPLTAVKEMHDILNSYYDLPPNFLPLETLYDMTKKPPSLFQLARTKIRAHMAESGKFCRENFKKLPLPKSMIDFVELDDLGDGKNVEEIMQSFDIFNEEDEE